MPIYYEDIEVGRVIELGSTTMSEAAVRSFAEEFDPQPIHVDDEAARERGFNGVIASGWHTIAVANRLVVDGFLRDAKNLGGLGADDVRWHAPVYPGDTLTVEMEAVAKRISESTGHGVVTRETRVANDEGHVLSYSTATLIARRNPESPP